MHKTSIKLPTKKNYITLTKKKKKKTDKKIKMS